MNFQFDFTKVSTHTVQTQTHWSDIRDPGGLALCEGKMKRGILKEESSQQREEAKHTGIARDTPTGGCGSETGSREAGVTTLRSLDFIPGTMGRIRTKNNVEATVSLASGLP